MTLPSLTRPKLAISLGDPAGIGSEVILKALSDPSIQAAADLRVVGSRTWLQKTYDTLKHQQLVEPLIHPDELELWDIESSDTFQWGEPSAVTGDLSFRYLDTAITQVLDHQVDGIITGPIAKSAWKAAGHLYPGHTELLAERAGVERFGMMFVAISPHTQWELRSLLATTHIPLSEVPKQLTPEGLTQKLDLLIETLAQDFGLTQPSIAISGLNPHSGEQGQLGTEEVTWLEPWLFEMRTLYPQATLSDLLPPDTMWVKPGQAWFGTTKVPNPHDAYLALYHDQGLIPVKLMAFDRAVNTTIGLPFVRTSPDHGTAFDIAGQGKANAESMKAAIRVAIAQVHQRQRRLASCS